MDSNNSQDSTQKYGEFVVQKLVEPTLQEDLMATLGLEDYSNFAQIINNLTYDLGMVLDEQNSLLSEVILGNGSFATVYKATNLQTDKQCALKYFQQENQQNLPQIVQEFHIQYLLNNLHKEKYVSFQPPVCLIQTYPNYLWNIAAELELGQCTLYQYIQSEPDILHDEYMAIFYQIFDSIISMHEHKYAHRDIKPQNIIYVKEKGWILSDFGCALKYELIEDQYNIEGTKAFQYEEIRKQIKQLFGQKQYAKINLFKNDLFAFCLTMAMLKYPKKTVVECQQMIENLSFEIPELNQIMTQLNEIELLLKMQALIPLQYEKTPPNLDFIKKQDPQKEDCLKLKLLKYDALIKADKSLDIKEFQQLQNQTESVFIKQQIHMKYFISGLIKEQIKPSLIVFPDSLSNSEAETLHNYLSYVGQYSKLLEIIPRCKSIGRIHVKILEIYYYIQLNDYEQAFIVANNQLSEIKNFTMIDIGFYYILKQLLIFQLKGELFQSIDYFLTYFTKLGGNALNLFKLIYFDLLQLQISYGYHFKIETLEHWLNPQSPQIFINQIYFLKAQGYYQLQNFEETQSNIQLLFQQLNPENLVVKELLLKLVSQEVDPIVMQIILHQIAESYFMLQKSKESCEYWQELINYCFKTPSIYLMHYYLNYGLALLQMRSYDQALYNFKIVIQNQGKVSLQLTARINVATIYIHMDDIKQSNEAIKEIFDLLSNEYIRRSDFIKIFKELTNCCFLLMQKQNLKQAKYIYLNLVQCYPKISITDFQIDITFQYTFLQVGSNLYYLLKDYQNFIDLQKQILEIQTQNQTQMIKYKDIGNTLLNLAKANIIMIESGDNINSICNYYQQFIDLYSNNDPLNPKLIEVYKELIDFCLERNNQRLQSTVECYVAYMIEHYGVENQLTQEAIQFLEIYE